ncbi:MAG: alkaline phosphatase family protein [Gammaproteobacteria bacterium]
MTYTNNHPIISDKARTTIRTSNGQSRARFSHSGSMAIGFPGKLHVGVRAGYVLRTRADPDDAGPERPFDFEPKTIPCQVEVRTPDGNLFTGDHVTLNDIRRFRDLRGVSRGTWTLKVSGESDPVATDDGDTRLLAGDASVNVTVVEAITSKSAPPLVNESLTASQHRQFAFDLWRVGTFTATATSGGLFTQRWALKLREPDGKVVAESATGRLDFPVTLRTLDQSRDAEGDPRPWSLEVMPAVGPEGDGDSWTRIDGKLKQVAVGAADLVWGVNKNDDIFRRDGSSWTRIDGALKQVAVAADGTIWGVNKNDDIFRRDGASWTRIDGKLKQVAVGAADLVWGVNENDDIFRRDGSSWTRIDGKLKQVAVAADGTIWGVNKNDDIFRRPGGTTRVLATVIEAARIGTTPLLNRVTEIIGARGSNLRIFGETDNERMYARLEILDDASASLIDRYKLLDKILPSVDQPPGVVVEPVDVEAKTLYNLAAPEREFGGGFKVHLFGMRIGAIDIEIGESVQIQPPIPALKVSVEVFGSAKIEWEGIGLANAEIRDNRIRLEAGLRLGPDGTFSLVSWIEEDPLDVEVANDALLAAIVAGLVLGPDTVVTVFTVAEFLESVINDSIGRSFKAVLDSVSAEVPEILAMILGDDFTYQALRFEGADIVFEHVAPLEPDPKPKPSDEYKAVIGRSFEPGGPPQTFLFRPPTLGNTWAADNLAKIDHIVMVMMENRSFDHVLGYIARTAAGTNSNGLSQDLTDFLGSLTDPLDPFNLQLYTVRRLRDSGIAENRFHLKTEFPVGVGHSFADVTEQLSEQITMPSGSGINSPAGFKANFKDRVTEGLVVDDVLGFYVAEDLAFFKFLTDNYAWCENFFCSHPGPTLPNRMFSIAGDVQYDRAGEAILDNNKGENFALSRAASIFDLLKRKGVSWRVYESFPSVTMLRMFARYATDTTNIVDIKRLAQDIADNNLPDVTYIDPAMHHFPEDDDHPPVDMYRGQRFLKDVYVALRANEEIWKKTLLIITYDEHGGFYDHVIPPIAELRLRRVGATEGGPADPAPFTPDMASTAYGVRVPTFVVSPWVPAGKGPDIVLDHCSILKTILARFCGQSRPFLSDRVHASRTFDSYLTETAPRLVDLSKLPELPPLPPDEPIRRSGVIVTEPVFNRQMRAGNVESHELMGMLARMLGRDSADSIA